MTILLFVAGGALLIGGAELLVRGASRLAGAAGIPPIVVGLTVVAFGTSAPELAVTLGSAWSGEADMALGNVVGSNIFNILFILGLSALIAPLAVARQLVRLDIPLMIGVSLLPLLLGLDGRVGRLDGGILFAGIVAYTGFLVWQSRDRPHEGGAEGSDGSRQERGPPDETGNGAPDQADRGGAKSRWAADLALVAAGLTLLVLGARWLVAGAISTAESLGVSELVIGLTIVAAGTSLPEVATSVLASLRGQRDIAVGNVVGSNIFNILAVLGLAGLTSPAGVGVPPGALTFDIPVMIGVAVATLPLLFTGYVIARWEGALFLGYYVAYTVYLVLDATDHEALPAVGAALGWFVLPLTGVTLLVLAAQALRRR